jgi:hypothetical protein
MAKFDKKEYEQICSLIAKAVREAGGESISREEKVFFIADVLAANLDDIPLFGNINAAVQSLYSIFKARKASGIPVVPNPWFVMNGHEERDNHVSQRYLHSRAWKSVGATALSMAGTAAEAVTVVNVGEIGNQVNAIGSTGAHMYRLNQIAKSYKGSVTISEWLTLVQKMKAAKLAIRAGSLGGSFIPICGDCLVGNLSALAKLGIKVTMTSACMTTAAAIHWRAFQEQQMSGGLGRGTGRKVGPASRIFWEIFTRRGVTRLFGKYDIDALVKEPAGWMALSDKLMLI